MCKKAFNTHPAPLFRGEVKAAEGIIQCSGISMFLVGANSCWRTVAYALPYTVNRRRETAPTDTGGFRFAT